MTRIASISTHPISVPRPLPVWTAHEEIRAWSVILTEIRTDDGLVGYGLIHGAPMPRICEWVARFGRNHSRHGRAGARGGMGPAVRADLAAARRASRDATALMRPVPRGERTQVMAAIAGIDIALWDLKGKAAGLPVYRLLGGENRPISTYATGGYYRPGAPNTAYAEELARFLDLGYRAVKLKTGAGTRRRGGRADRRGARRDRRRARPDARHERALRSAGLHRVRPRGRAARASSGSRSRCTGICSRPISRGSRRRRRSRWRMASAS